MTRTLILGAVISAILAFAPNYALADESEGLSSAPVAPSLGIAEHAFQVAQGKKQQGGGGGGGQTCPTGYADCDGVKSNKCETNIGTDVNNCGSCGKVCGPYPNATAACTNGTCQLASCNTGYGDCDGNPSNGCETNLQTEANNCGACGTVCSFPNATSSCTNGTCGMANCTAGYADCDGNPSNGCEVNTQTDVINCGACGNYCTELPNVDYPKCTNGTCGIASCRFGYGDCDGNSSNGCETNTGGDTNNCGTCGKVCSLPNVASHTCTNGSCGIASCNTGYGDCDGKPYTGCEVNLGTDPNNCSACGKVCGPYPNATSGCSQGNCVLGACARPYRNCDGNTSTGCETNTGGDVNNCGTCGKVCSLANATSTCTNGSCQIAGCASGYGNCDGNPSNGCETNIQSDKNNCGGCGKTCGSNEYCLLGTCKRLF